MVHIADLGGTFVFAIEGAPAGRLDPIGVLVLTFATALGGGIVRDLLIGEILPGLLIALDAAIPACFCLHLVAVSRHWLLPTWPS